MLKSAAVPLIFLSALAASACARMAPVAEAVVAVPRAAASQTAEFFQDLFSSPMKAVEAQELGRSAFCNSQGREAAVNLFTDVAQLRAWEISRGVQLTPVTGQLPAGQYVVAEMGERNTGGYALVVSRQAAASADALYLKASFLHPGTAAMATQSITSPCALIAVRSAVAFSSVTLLDGANKPRAIWTLATASGPIEATAPQAVEKPVDDKDSQSTEVLHPQALESQTPDEPMPKIESLPLPAQTPSVSPTP